MGSRWLPRLVAAGAAAGLFALASPAYAADVTIPLQGSLPRTVASATNGCDAYSGGPAVAGFDTWVFNLPGSSSEGSSDPSEHFVTVTATWSTGGSPASVTLTIPTAPNSGIVHNGTSKAFIKLPAGYTLTAASAVVTAGSKDFFTLTHICKATTSTSPSPSTSPNGTPSPETSPSTGTSQSPGTSPSTGTSQSTGTETSPAASPSTSPTGGLPVTGTAVTGIVVTGVVLLGLGAGLLLLQRRRALTDAAE